MKVIRLEESDERWKNFLDKYSHLIIHTPNYKEFIEKSFNKTTAEYLAIEDEEEIKLIVFVFSIFIKLLLFNICIALPTDVGEIFNFLAISL